jgi:hypothetical protein
MTSARFVVFASALVLGLATSIACMDLENHRLQVASEILAGTLLICGLAMLGVGLRLLAL